MSERIARSERREGGAALVITVLVMVLLAMLAMTSLKDSEQEATAGARARATTRTLYAADAGIQLALSRLTQTPPDLTPFDLTLADGAGAQSRTRSQTAPDNIHQVGLGETEEGYALNVGAGASSVTRIYQVNVTAAYSNASTAELEARLGRSEVIATGY